LSSKSTITSAPRRKDPFAGSRSAGGAARRLRPSTDPQWEGAGNRTEFIERDFQRQNFGYSRTNRAGGHTGEIGGKFYRTEPRDPMHGYYADDIGALTLDDPIGFSGSVAFTAGGTDAGMFFGCFNREQKIRPLRDPREGAPLNDSLGIEIDGPTRIGYYFSALCSPTRALASMAHGPVFLPDRTRHSSLPIRSTRLRAYHRAPRRGRVPPRPHAAATESRRPLRSLRNHEHPARRQIRNHLFR